MYTHAVRRVLAISRWGARCTRWRTARTRSKRPTRTRARRSSCPPCLAASIFLVTGACALCNTGDAQHAHDTCTTHTHTHTHDAHAHARTHAHTLRSLHPPSLYLGVQAPLGGIAVARATPHAQEHGRATLHRRSHPQRRAHALCLTPSECSCPRQKIEGDWGPGNAPRRPVKIWKFRFTREIPMCLLPLERGRIFPGLWGVLSGRSAA